MHVSRTSIAYRYAAILLTALSKLVDSGMIELSRSIDSFATYNVLSFFTYRIDGRYRRSLGDWGKILDTRIQHGYNAASVLNSLRTAAVCRQCRRNKGKIIDHMRPRERNDGSIEWYCLECGGTETLERKLTTKNIKKMEGKVAQEIERLKHSISVYKRLQGIFSAELKQRRDLREILKTEFARQEKESHYLSFHRPKAYFIQHFDPSKKWKKRRCSLSKANILKIRITDPAYNRDIQLLAYILRKNPDKIPSKCIGGVNRCIHRLTELGFPEEYATDKFQTDVELQLTLAWLVSYTSK